MIIVRISCDVQKDRFVKLSEGTHSFGADFDCDVVLIDEAIQPQHFFLEYDGTSANLSLSKGANATLSFEDTQTPLDSGAPAVWKTSQTLYIEGLSLSLSSCAPTQPLVFENISTARLMFRYAFKTFLRNTSILVGVAAIGMVGYNVVSAGLANPVPPPTVKRRLKMAPQSAAKSIQETEEFLISKGFGPTSIVRNNDRFFAVFHVSSTKARDGLKKLALNSFPDLELQIFVDSVLLSAANLTLQLSKKVLGERTVTNGNLVISGASVAGVELDEIKRLVLSDVPGIKSVIFSQSQNPIQKEIPAMIAGIWNGPNPYLILTTGTEVHLGQELMPNVTFEGIQSLTSLLVKINEIPTEIALK